MIRWPIRRQTNAEPKSVANSPPHRRGSQVRGEVPQEFEITPKKDAGIVILLSLTLIKAVAQSVKNDFIQALGQQGLVG